MGHWFGNPSNDTQENPKDAQKSTNFHEKCTKPTETTELVEKNKNLAAEKDKLDKEKTELTEKNKNLTTEKDNLTNQLNASQKQVKALQDSQQVLKNEKAELERRHAPYQKLEKLYEVFLEVKDRLNFNFVATTHSAMDLIASVLSDSKYYLENLYNQASQELGDKRSDKGEKLAELFDLLFEYVKDSKFERLKEPSAYDYSCKTLYLEQNTSQKMRRVVLRGYKHNDKVYHTIVDMGS
ncbi:M protein [Helicobacter pylori]|uniref:M protein n=1 Tax=Helicobacter pylori TaxID=210 RepID=UPI0024BA02A8|nr:M protein [Helicobacter pylori]